MANSDRSSRLFVFLAVLMVHVILFNMVSGIARQDQYKRRYSAGTNAGEATRLIVSLLPYDLPELQKSVHPRANGNPSSTRQSTHRPEMKGWGEISSVPVAPSVASLPVPAASEPAPVAVKPPLRLDDKTIKKAIADVAKGTVRSMAKSAGRLDEIEPVRQDKFAASVSRAASPSLREMAEAYITIAKAESCKPDYAKSGIRAIGSDTIWSLTGSNPNDCKK